MAPTTNQIFFSRSVFGDELAGILDALFAVQRTMRLGRVPPPSGTSLYEAYALADFFYTSFEVHELLRAEQSQHWATPLRARPIQEVLPDLAMMLPPQYTALAIRERIEQLF